MFSYFSIAIVPLFIAGIIGYSMMKKQPVFDFFVQGAKEGLASAVGVLPTLVGLVTAIAMLRASGALDVVGRAFAPLLGKVGFPPALVPLALMRPVSGSGALAMVKDLLTQYGADSLIGRTASVMMGASETTFYTLAIYLGSVGIKQARYTLKAALLADFVMVTASFVFVLLLLH